MKAKTLIKKFSAAFATLCLCASAVVASPSFMCTNQVSASGLPAGTQVHSVYTNELIPAEQAGVRPIAIMMPTDKSAQPSYGISNAKILYEIMEEGEISRQLAIIDNWQGLSKIGNIRSCRDYYIPIATEWDPILIHFGGVYYMADRITAPDINNLSGTYEYGGGGSMPGSGYFFRSSDRKAPHNAYISADGITKACASLGYSLAIRPEYYNASHFTFSSGVNTLSQYPSAITANTIDLSKIFTYTKSSFTYNAETGLYYKSLHGKAQTDGLNKQQLTFSNVIIQNTKWAVRDAKGYLAFQVIDNTGDGYYFTQGKGIHITWQKASDYSPTKYYDDNGKEIQLNTGKTYIGIAQEGRAVIVK
ncbi:MAG: DUF3048 domain-containing protein [Lachnospiraceae bacterium]|nr:DUF3048 domain-containing protein [Lachnospiraceae bacterium]